MASRSMAAPARLTSMARPVRLVSPTIRSRSSVSHRISSRLETRENAYELDAHTRFLLLSSVVAGGPLFSRRDERGPPGKFGQNTDVLVLAIGVAEFDVAIDQSEQRVVAPNTDVSAWLDPCAALAHDDAAGGDKLAIKAFDAEHFGIAVPTVAGASHAFFMCH